jgi:hypothetical protein
MNTQRKDLRNMKEICKNSVNPLKDLMYKSWELKKYKRSKTKASELYFKELISETFLNLEKETTIQV